MAVLAKIRDKSLLLIIVIALGLFAFVIDPTTVMSFFDGSQNKNFIGKVDGETIDTQEFGNEVEQLKRSRPGTTNNAAVTQVWDKKIKDVLFEKEYESLGITVEKDQLWDAITLAYSNSPQFQNENGEFDENLLRSFIDDQTKLDPNYPNFLDEQFSYYAKQQTLFNLIRAGIGATEKDGEQTYRFENDQVDLQFVQIPYTSIADTLVDVSSEEITKFINEHKDDFETEAHTEINAVLFEEKPSDADDAAVKESIIKLLDDKNVVNSKGQDELVKGLRNTDDLALFLAENSDLPFDSIPKLKTQVNAAIADTIFKMPAGSLSEVYKEGEYYKVSRVLGFDKEEKRRASHILVAYQGAQRASADITRTEEEAKQKADSLLAVIKGSSKDFADWAKENSDGPSASKGGDLDFFNRTTMAPEFTEFSFDNEVGDIGVVKTAFGYHVIKVTDQKEEDKIKLATLALKINPSEETLDKVYRDAQNYELELSKGGDIMEIAKKYNVEVRPLKKITELSENIGTVPGNQRELVRWTFNEETNIGDVKRFDADTGHVIAQLTKRTEGGLATPEEVSVTVLPKVRNKKKAEMIRSDKASYATLAELANASGQTVQKATAITMSSPRLPGTSNEGKVVGAAFNMKDGQTSGLISGEQGVYMIEISKLTKAADQESYKKYADQTSTQNTNAIGTKVFEALKKKAEIEDNRASVY